MNAKAALPPLSGATLVAGTVALSLATFMNVLDTTIANVSIPSIAGDLGVSPSQGTWVITSFAVGQCHRRAAHRLADPAFWSGAPVCQFHPVICAGLAALWASTQSRHPDRFSRATRCRCRADDSAVAGAVAVLLPSDGPGHVVDDFAALLLGHLAPLSPLPFGKSVPRCIMPSWSNI